MQPAASIHLSYLGSRRTWGRSKTAERPKIDAATRGRGGQEDPFGGPMGSEIRVFWLGFLDLLPWADCRRHYKSLRPLRTLSTKKRR